MVLPAYLCCSYFRPLLATFQSCRDQWRLLLNAKWLSTGPFRMSSHQPAFLLLLDQDPFSLEPLSRVAPRDVIIRGSCCERLADLFSCSCHSFRVCDPRKSPNTGATMKEITVRPDQVCHDIKMLLFVRRRINNTTTITLLLSIVRSPSISSLILNSATAVRAEVYYWHESLSTVCIPQSVGARAVVVSHRRMFVHPFQIEWHINVLKYQQFP